MDETKIPGHIAIIMDGNGRWAKKRLLPRSAGHRAGMKRMIGLSEHIFDCGVRCCTMFALSTENLSRSKEELDGLFALLREYFPENAEILRGKNITLRVIGDRTLLPADVVQVIEAGEKRTAGGTRGTLVLAIGYGGRQDILAAVNQAVRAGKDDGGVLFHALGGRPARTRSAHPHGAGKAHLQFFAVAGGLQRTVFYRRSLPGLFRSGAG